jgi:hypothetical protein
MSDALQKVFEEHARETRKTLKDLANAVGELGGRITKVELLAGEAKQAAERAKMDGEGHEHAMLGAFNAHKTDITKALEASTEASAKRRREDRKFYLQMALIVMPILTATLSRGAQEIGRPAPVPVTLQPQMVAPAPPTLPLLPGVSLDGGHP